MGKIKNAKNFSSAFNIDKNLVKDAGVVDVILNADTLLFIDPLLLKKSRHPEIAAAANDRYHQRFRQLISVLAASSSPGDLPWRNARRLFQFHEIPWTCLGYGVSVHGSGFGKGLIETTLATAKEIIDLGICDPDLFLALALFEEGIGADRISDMTTNIILPDLIKFNERITKTLGINTHACSINGHLGELAVNPLSEGDFPLLLVPDDVVRDLPLAVDWGDISDVVKTNEDLRERVSRDIGQIFASMTRAQKNELKDSVLRNRVAFEEILEILKRAEPKPYDLEQDIRGEIFWGDLIDRIAAEFPTDLSRYTNRVLSFVEVGNLVKQIVDQFQFLVEQRGLWRELWDERYERNRKEKAAQRLFYAVAHSYCQANDLDITPEAETGNGPVDFKVSSGFSGRVLVEVKLSTNGRLVHGYERQLEIYSRAEQAVVGYYLVIDIGGMGRKDELLVAAKNRAVQAGDRASEIVFVDGSPRESASKRH